MNIFDNIEETLIYFDRPLLFISKLDNKKYICTLIEIREEAEYWLTSEISDSTIDELKANKIDYRDSFLESGMCQLLTVTESNIKKKKVLYVTDDMLPKKGSYYKNRRVPDKE